MAIQQWLSFVPLSQQQERGVNFFDLFVQHLIMYKCLIFTMEKSTEKTYKIGFIPKSFKHSWT